MDMSSSGMFRVTNSALARLYWYIIVGVLILGLLLKSMRMFNTWWRFVKASEHTVEYISLTFRL
jgi:hypothetical protein